MKLLPLQSPTRFSLPTKNIGAAEQVGGTVKPSALAALRLVANSYLVGATGLAAARARQ